MRYEPFPLPDSEFARRIRWLETAFHKWDTHVQGRCTVARGTLILTQEEHERIVAASERLARITAEARQCLAVAPSEAGLLGLSPDVTGLATDSTAGHLISRFDFFMTEDGWKVSEFNDDAPGGYNDALGLPAVFHDVAPATAGLAGNLPQDLTVALNDGGRPVGLVYATAYSEDLQVVRLLADLLEADGAEVVLASPAHLSVENGEAVLDGVPVGHMYRFFPVEWFPLLPNVHAWKELAILGVPVVNPFCGAWTQSKAIFSTGRN